MARVSRGGKGKTLYVDLSVYPCGRADPEKNLTISCPDSDTQFRTTLSDAGLKKFKTRYLDFINNTFLIEGGDLNGAHKEKRQYLPN